MIKLEREKICPLPIQMIGNHVKELFGGMEGDEEMVCQDQRPEHAQSLTLICSLILNLVLIQVEEEGRGRNLGEECGQCEDLLVEVNVNVRLTESGNVICKSLPPSPYPYVYAHSCIVWE